MLQMAASVPGVTFEACIYPLHPHMREVQEQVLVKLAPTYSEIHDCRANYCRATAPQHEGGAEAGWSNPSQLLPSHCITGCKVCPILADLAEILDSALPQLLCPMSPVAMLP
ncbi:unnamed protein product [Polarella glacialis]|uniref:Uncharacterized protein n=1 Tax=Polarella glacialis TaxID=89957 RepID=A0A813KU78_POLGL|nr:unnamed protein product [Polarella glacialis]